MNEDDDDVHYDGFYLKKKTKNLHISNEMENG